MKLKSFLGTFAAICLAAAQLFAVPSELMCNMKEHPATADWANVSSPANATSVRSLSLDIKILQPSAKIVVTTQAKGAFSAQAGFSQTISPVVIGNTHRLSLPVSVNPGQEEGTYETVLTSYDAAGNVLKTVSISLNAYVTDGKLYYGPESLISLQQEYVADLEKSGAITASESLQTRKDLATQSEIVTLPATGFSSKATSSKPTENLAITGVVKWKDHSGTGGTGKLFPVIGMKIEAVDKANPATVLATGVTGRDGTYALNIAKDAIDATTAAFTLILKAETTQPKFNVKTTGVAGTTYTFEREFANVTGQASITANAALFNITFDKIGAPNPAATIDQNRAWGVYSCLFLLNEFTSASAQVSGAPFLPCNFPVGGAVSYFGGGEGFILSGDYADYDVIFHEYGHFIQSRYNLTQVPVAPAGSGHSFSDELITRYDKTKGLAMAWSEGMATAIGQAIQYSAKYPNTLAPRFGNLSYDDSEDSSISINAESEDRYKNFSEGNEATTLRALYDLFDDSLSGEGFDKVAWGFDTFMSKIKASGSKNIATFWDNITSGLITPGGKVTQQTFVHRTVQDQFSPLFAKNNIAPDPISPKNKAEVDAFTGDKVTFKWKQNINSVHAGQKFRVLIMNTAGNVIKSSDEVAGKAGDTQELEVPKTLIEDARTAAPSEPLFWTVAGIDSAAPATGVYVGPPLPLDATGRILFVIDDTGSMSGEIGAVRDGLLSFLSRFDSTSNSTSFRLITFKDDVSPRAATNNLATIQSQVSTLTASGGGDTPESSVEALWFAAATLAAEGTGGTVFLATDAPPHSGLSIPATVAALRSAGVRVNIILTESGFAKPGPDVQAGPAAKTNDLDEDGVDVPSTIDLLSLIPDSSFTGSTDAYGDIADGTGGVLITLNKSNISGIKAAVENLTASSVFPALVQVSPRKAPVNATLDVKIDAQNTNFDSSSTLTLTNGINVNSVSRLSPFEILANITIPSTATVGLANATVTTGSEVATGVKVFEVTTATTAPTVLSVSPNSGPRGSTVSVRISGLNTSFTNASTVSFGSGITVTNLRTLSPTSITADLVIAEDASRTLRSLNVDSASVADAFRVTSDTSVTLASITSVAPGAVLRNSTVNLTITGVGTTFDGTSTVAFSGSGVQVNSVTLVNAQTLRANVTIRDSASLSFRDVAVNTGGTTVVGLQLLQIVPKAEVPPAVTGDIIVSIGKITLKRKTGLFEQSVIVKNNSTARAAVKLTVSGLPKKGVVFNKKGKKGKSFYLITPALAPGETKKITIKYLIPNRKKPKPHFSAELF